MHMNMNPIFLGFIFIFGVVLWKVAKECLSQAKFPSDVFFSSPGVHSLMQVRFCSIIFLFKRILQMVFWHNHAEPFAHWFQVQVWHIIACASMESLNWEISPWNESASKWTAFLVFFVAGASPTFWSVIMFSNWSVFSKNCLFGIESRLCPHPPALIAPPHLIAPQHLPQDGSASFRWWCLSYHPP